jgi:hypothetical protein
MLTNPLHFVKLYLDLLNDSLKEVGGRLTKAQMAWLAFCLTAMVFTNMINWKAWERWSGGKYSDSALSKMLHWGLIPWNALLLASTRLLLSRYNIRKGVLIIDDSDHQRSKNTTNIAYVHRIKDKKNEGYFNGQNLIFLLLVTDRITLPVGFTFYMPDPEIKKWKEEDGALRKCNVQKAHRPKKPPRRIEYPSKLGLALGLLSQFFEAHPTVQIKCILADAFYGSAEFVQKAAEFQGGMQVISQLRSTQLVRNKRGLLVDLKSCFEADRANTTCSKIFIRGGKEEIVFINAQKLWVDAHRAKRVVIAIRYSNEKEFRYIIASDLTWQVVDIVQAYTLRWLVEVFFQDWKSYEAWNNLAKQQGVEGSCRCVILSLLLDHSFFFHELQQPCIENKLPLYTMGSLTEHSRLQIIFNAISSLFTSTRPEIEYENVKNSLLEAISLGKACSTKHMSHRGFQNVLPKAA